jgi:phosphoesterase RecJ-like protein
MKNTYEKAVAVQDLINTAQKIVIVQADNPDADSLGSALALDHILADMGKQPVLYCGVDMPGYLHYMQGWDRVEKELPPTFDSSIIVDASTMSLLERLIQSGQQTWLAAKPCLVLDHHETVDNIIPFSQVMVNDSLRASTGELIYLLAKQLDWAMSIEAQEYLMASILGDTQGLSNQLASAETYRVMAAMTEIGVNRPALEEKRRLYSRMPQIIYKYKAELIKRTEFDHEGRVATVVVTQPEINKFSPLYNPAP